jgi:putative oxidoreductase
MLTINVGIFVLRLLTGLLFIGHGAQKLFGWFGGHGLQATAKWLEGLNYRPARFWALCAGLGELLGGLGLALGLFTPIAAALIIGVLFTAILKVHWANGLWVSQNGMEYALTNLVVAAFIGLFGPGSYALDSLLRMHYPMPLTFGIAVVVVLLSAIAGLLSTARRARTEQQYA